MNEHFNHSEAARKSKLQKSEKNPAKSGDPEHHQSCINVVFCQGRLPSRSSSVEVVFQSASFGNDERKGPKHFFIFGFNYGSIEV